MSTTINVIPVRTNKERISFIKLQWNIYKNDSNWVPPLISDRKEFFHPRKNPFFKHGEVELFLAVRDKKYVGRIAAIVNHNYNKFQNEYAGFFGCFEAINNYNVIEALFNTALNWLKEKRAEIVYGPASFTANDEYGLLVEGFDSPPMIMMPYNPQYYIELIEEYGFRKARDLMAYIKDNTPMDDRVKKISERIQERKKINLRIINMKLLNQEIIILKELYNKVLEGIWGFVPLTDAEISSMAGHLKQIVDPNLIYFAEVNSKPVGFVLSLPDINQALIKLNGRLFPIGLFKLLWHARKINQLRIAVLGVLPEYRNWGIDSLLYIKTFETGVQRGYKLGEMSFILEDNVMMNRITKSLGGVLYKRYRIYEKKLV